MVAELHLAIMAYWDTINTIGNSCVFLFTVYNQDELGHSFNSGVRATVSII